MRPKNLIILMFAMTVLGGCLLNGAYQMRSDNIKIPRDRAVILFAAADDRSADGQTSFTMQFDEFSLQTGAIEGNCFHYTRMKAEADAAVGERVYFVFNTVPGHYILSPFLGFANNPEMNVAFHAPAGVATYLGDFLESGGEAPYWRGSMKRVDDLDGANTFAAGLGLPSLHRAETTPIQSRGPIFVCTP
jgi:hypothetical protein